MFSGGGGGQGWGGVAGEGLLEEVTTVLGPKGGEGGNSQGHRRLGASCVGT